MKLFQPVVLAVLLKCIEAVVQVSPTWLTSPYVQANSRKLINNVLTGSTTFTISPITFTTAFTASPNLAYGISQYEADDTLNKELFEISRTALSASSFGVQVKLVDSTNLYMLQIRYIAISKTFPHHLNCFDNVPINYNNGGLTNITTASLSVKSYTNTINYSAHAATIGSTYTTFSLPLTNNKVILFMTSLYSDGNEGDNSGDPLYPLNLNVLAEVTSTTTYRLSCNVSLNVNISKLHFSILAFDQVSVQASGQYMIVHDKVCYTTAGGTYNFPSQFLTNFIIGFVEYSSNKSRANIFFGEYFGTYNGSYGAQMPLAVCRDTSDTPLTRYCFTIFYLKTWLCPNDTFFDPSINLCTSCPIVNCRDCLNLTVCLLCDQANDYFLNNATGQCDQCAIAGCTNCSSPTVCQTCDSGANYVLLTNHTCQLCDASLNYFPNLIQQSCDLCNISNCLNCSSLTTCQKCNSAASFYLNPSFTCSYCDPGLNYFIDPVSFDCDVCTITECLNCSSLAACRECNETHNYFLGNDSQCHLCTPTNCVSCSNLTACAVCDVLAGFVINPTTLLCELCSIPGCTNCSDTATCAKCNNTANYVLTGATCTQCTAPTTFANLTSSQCEPCAVAHCSTCDTLSACATCDSNSSYYLLPGLTCGFCDPANNSFINSTLGCEVCSLSNCLVCSSLTSCSQCNEAAQYFQNASDNNLCYLCTPTNCVDCYNLTACNACDTNAGYVLNASSLCELCPAGLFPNPVTNLCEACTLSDCSVCSSLTACQTCTYNASYYLLPGLTCGYCDPANNTFINMTSGTYNCEACTLSNCLVCSSLTSCSQCNEAAQYFQNASDNNLCYLCAPTNCIDCYNLTACNVCDINAGYALNASTGLCELCPSGLFPNATSYQCEPCAVPNCANCTTLTTCNTCDYNSSYYLLPGLTCGYCDPANNTFINMTSGTYNCEACALSNCLVCVSLTSCSQCNEAAQYFQNASDNNLCYLCAPTNCIDCYNLTACNVCDINAGYALNASTGLCELCPSGLFPNATSYQCEPCAVPNCANCTTLTTCNTCDYNSSYYLLPGLTCGYCDPANNTFINMTSGTYNCEACLTPNCINCSSLTTCSICDTSNNYLLNTTDNLCYLCGLPNCLQCANFSACTVCDEGSGYFLNSSTGLCQFCALGGCVECSSLTVCRVCDSNNSYGFDYTSPNMSLCGPCNVSCLCDGYGLPWDATAQACTPECGDGLIRVDEECDDNNTDSYDGCSASCVVEDYYACTGQPSVCNETLFIQSEFVAIAKEGCNGFKITVQTPRFTLDQISQNIHILNRNVSITKTVQNGSLIDIYAEYTRDIANETIQLHFSPGQILNIAYKPTTPALYYTEEQCNVSDQVEKMLQAAEIISYAILILSILSCKIVGLELFGVLQLSYFTLSSHSFLNVYLAPLTKFRTFNGLNLGIKGETSQVPENYSKMGVAGTFINNCNVMLFLLFGEFVVALILYIISKLARKEKLEKLALRLMKQGFVTLVLFNIFNISFSAGVHWKYAVPTDDGYILSSVILYGTLIAMVVAVGAMELTSKEDYGEFKKKFKNVWICQLYIPLTVVYRMVLGFYSAVKSDYDEGTLIILAFSLAFMLYTIVNLPFTNVFQNYRCSLIHITMLYTLLTTNYYRSMKSTTPIEVKGRIYGPAIVELILMVTCIGISFVVLVYEIYHLIKEWRTQKKTENKIVRQRQVTQQSFQNL